MSLPPDYLDAIADARNPAWAPLVMPWPMPGNLGGMVSFRTFAEWRGFILGFGLHRCVPRVVASKFERAQKLYVLAWLDSDLVKAGELVAFTALELAVRDRYAGDERTRRTQIAVEKAKEENRTVSQKEKRWIDSASFADLLRIMVERSQLTEDQIPMNQRCGPPSNVLGRILGDAKPTLPHIRNDAAHGAPFDGLPWSGLLELVRDLIDHAYRDWIVQESFVPELHSNIGDQDYE